MNEKPDKFTLWVNRQPIIIGLPICFLACCAGAVVWSVPVWAVVLLIGWLYRL